jgi:hypothetical protein
VQPGAAKAHVITVVQHGAGGVERLHQTRQRPPVQGGSPWDADRTVALQLSRAQR